MADFNNDGFDDLVVGAPGEAPGADPQSGYGFVFKGSATGLVASQGLDQAGLGANENGDKFGATLATGDFNNDGFDDLVVGAPGESPGADPQSGYAFVYKGSTNGLAASQGLDQAGLGANENGDKFGAALAVGDFNNDGFDDLVVGAPGEAPGADPQSGYAFVYKGSTTGLVASQGLSQAGLGANENGDLFGAALTVGDFNNDGFDDLAVGAPGEAPGADPQSGYAFIFHGSVSGLVANQGLDQAGLGANENGDLFGAALPGSSSFTINEELNLFNIAPPPLAVSL
ncbi:FG-GAP-like repeat-containing protein [Lyngbya aestuarii]|uniref:FG-GAP-like repeat-containing protein n=1 Tax=Lyngbya aestuarii TaxID=118322 RepID=UPI00403DADD7